jgi:hypothetical protein
MKIKLLYVKGLQEMELAKPSRGAEEKEERKETNENVVSSPKMERCEIIPGNNVKNDFGTWFLSILTSTNYLKNFDTVYDGYTEGEIPKDKTLFGVSDVDVTMTMEKNSITLEYITKEDQKQLQGEREQIEERAEHVMSESEYMSMVNHLAHSRQKKEKVKRIAVKKIIIEYEETDEEKPLDVDSVLDDLGIFDEDLIGTGRLNEMMKNRKNDY